MDALRRYGPSLAWCLPIASLTGCSLFSIPPAVPSSAQPAPAPPPAVVAATPAADDARLATDEAREADAPRMSAIEHWAEQMAQRRQSAGDRTGGRAKRDIFEERAGANALFADSQAADASLSHDANPPSGGLKPVAPAAPAVDREPDSPAPLGVAPKSAPSEAPAGEPTARRPETPPALQGVNVSSAVEWRDRDDSVARPASANAADSAGDSTTTWKHAIDEWLARSAADATFRQQFDRRVLYVLAGDYAEARRPIDMATAEQQAMAGRFIEALIAVQEGHGGEPGREAGRVLAHVDSLRDALLPAAELVLPALVICRAVKGFGQYEPLDPAQFPAGRDNEFVAYCEIRDFVSERRSDGAYQSRFGMRLGVFNRVGDRVHEMNVDEIIDRCRSQRRDCFLSPVVRLPATLAPGEYVLKVAISDKIGQKVAEQAAAFRIVAK